MLKAGWNSIRHNFVDAFKRPTQNIAPVDGIRALSQLAIMLYHCFFLTRMTGDADQFKHMVQNTPWYFGWVWTLDYSVDAFFVISGYLIATILFREHTKTGDINLIRFYWRRYLRLTPAYFAFMLLYIALAPKFNSTVWANFLYVNNFIPLQEVSMSWTWSLAVEEQFYLLFPAILLWFVLKGKQPLVPLISLLMASIACATLVYVTDDILWNSTHLDVLFNYEIFNHFYDRYYVNLHTRFGPFVSGAILAYLLLYRSADMRALRENKVLFNGINLIALLMLIYALAFNPYSGNPSLAASRWHLIMDRNLFGLALSWTIFATLGNPGILKPIQKVLSLKIWYPFAQFSYSMYLFHYLVVIFVIANLLAYLKRAGLLEPGMDFPYLWLMPAYLLVVILTMIPSILLYTLVEKPFLDLRNRLSTTAPSKVVLSANTQS